MPPHPNIIGFHFVSLVETWPFVWQIESYSNYLLMGMEYAKDGTLIDIKKDR